MKIDAIKNGEPVELTIIAYKGFDKNWQCSPNGIPFQYKMGETYIHDGKIQACKTGFHSCENPLDIFKYYSPGDSQFAIVEISGELCRHDDDSKVASGKITLKAELKIPVIVEKAVAWITALCVPANAQHATGYRSASSATGYQSASSATGYQSASSATGYQSASSATGDRSASSATGYQSASSATGYQSASSATGDRSASSATGDQSASSATGDRSASSATGYQSASSATGDRSASSATGEGAVAMSIGYQSRSAADKDGAIVCVYRDHNYKLIHIKASKVGDNGIEPNVFYTLDEHGEFVKVAS